MAARLVLRNKHISAAASLSQLHWLPISKRIDFKLATITYKLLITQQPAYLRSLINYQVYSYQSRSAAQHKLHESAVHTTIGQRAFSSASPRVFNGIPLDVRSAPSTQSFKRQLKTFYTRSLTT